MVIPGSWFDNLSVGQAILIRSEEPSKMPIPEAQELSDELYAEVGGEG